MLSLNTIICGTNDAPFTDQIGKFQVCVVSGIIAASLQKQMPSTFIRHDFAGVLFSAFDAVFLATAGRGFS